MTIETIKNHPIYKKVLADSFGGVMYNVADYGKHDPSEVLAIWETLTESEKNVSGGIMKGAIEFMKGN